MLSNELWMGMPINSIWLQFTHKVVLASVQNNVQIALRSNYQHNQMVGLFLKKMLDFVKPISR